MKKDYNDFFEGVRVNKKELNDYNKILIIKNNKNLTVQEVKRILKEKYQDITNEEIERLICKMNKEKKWPKTKHKVQCDKNKEDVKNEENCER